MCVCVSVALAEEFTMMKEMGLPTMLINSFDDLEPEVGGNMVG